MEMSVFNGCDHLILIRILSIGSGSKPRSSHIYSVSARCHCCL